jgi:hypothetical protein
LRLRVDGEVHEEVKRKGERVTAIWEGKRKETDCETYYMNESLISFERKEFVHCAIMRKALSTSHPNEAYSSESKSITRKYSKSINSDVENTR